MRPPAKTPSLWLSLLPCILLLALLVVNVSLFSDDASSGPNQLALLFSAVFAGALGHYVLAMDYRKIQGRAIKSITLAMEAVIILLIVGCLIGLWIVSGVVPAMIYYGVQALHPAVFLLLACVICSVVSLAIGSSWSTMGTVGVALIGIGAALGFPVSLVAGAIISGAYFGDKMSPLSDTTNLAPAVAGAELFTHIKHMFYTTIPAYTLTLAAFAAIGFFYTPGEYSVTTVADISGVIASHFHIRWYLLLIPALVIVLAARRMPAIPALLIGALLGGATALVFQPQQLTANPNETLRLSDAYIALVSTAYSGFTMETGNEMVDGLLSRGGMVNMFSTISLILMAMLFGGVMESTGMLPRIAQAILGRVRGAGSLIGATVGSSVLFNLFAAEQYLAIVIPGRMFRQAYETHNLDPRNLSRALEDGGTVTSVLVPWNTCGAFASSVLAVPTLSYLPFCFFNLLCPLVSITMATFHLAIVEAQEPPEQEETA